MTMTAEQLYELLPAVYRLRDADRGYQLKKLVAVLAEQAAILREDIEQSYDDSFIESCADWVVPYIGDLIGYRQLHGVAPGIASPRAEVANTLDHRSRKGTAAMLEQLARDVTGWPARVVEYGNLLATTQFPNHIRPANLFTVDFRNSQTLALLDSPFDDMPRTFEARRIATGAGRYNIPNIGIFFWRLPPFKLTRSRAAEVSGQDRLFRFHPNGIDTALIAQPEPETGNTGLARPVNVPRPIMRRELLDSIRNAPGGTTSALYGLGESIEVFIGEDLVPSEDIRICNLSGDDAAGWLHTPEDKITIDPELGRLVLPAPPEAPVTVSFCYLFSDAMGGGEYSRPQTGAADLTLSSLDPSASINDAIASLPAGGIIEIEGSGRISEVIDLELAEGASVTLRAADGARPHVALQQDITVRGNTSSGLSLDGLLISGGAIVIPDEAEGIGTLSLSHSTIVPGRTLLPDGTSASPEEPALKVGHGATKVRIEACICGAIQTADDSVIDISASLIDAADPARFAISGIGDGEAERSLAGIITLEQTTVIGRIAAQELTLVSDSLIDATTRDGDPPDARPVDVYRQQSGCIRFSFIPLRSRTPRRFRCQPDLAIAAAVASAEQRLGRRLTASERLALTRRIARRVRPRFNSRRYGQSAYGQLSHVTGEELRGGAENGAEMGVFNRLYQPQREANIAIRLEEYLRFGLEAGLFFET